jgi:hypothetical protein
MSKLEAAARRSRDRAGIASPDGLGKVGRPAIGPNVQVRLTPATIARVDEIAAREGVTRSDVIRRMIEGALTAG